MKTRQQDKPQHAAVVDQKRDTVAKEIGQVKTPQCHCLLHKEHFSNMSSTAFWHPPSNRSSKWILKSKTQKYVHQINLQTVYADEYGHIAFSWHKNITKGIINAAKMAWSERYMLHNLWTWVSCSYAKKPGLAAHVLNRSAELETGGYLWLLARPLKSGSGRHHISKINVESLTSISGLCMYIHACMPSHRCIYICVCAHTYKHTSKMKKVP